MALIHRMADAVFTRLVPDKTADAACIAGCTNSYRCVATACQGRFTRPEQYCVSGCHEYRQFVRCGC